jgi:hypothetical protein
LFGKLAIDIGERTPLSISVASADSAFIDAKRGACSTIFGQAADLKTISNAFTRDQIEYRISSIWVPTDQIEQARKEAAQHQREEAQRAQQQKELLDQMRAESEHRKLLEGEARRQETERLQRENRSNARAAEEQSKPQ